MIRKADILCATSYHTAHHESPRSALQNNTSKYDPISSDNFARYTSWKKTVYIYEEISYTKVKKSSPSFPPYNDEVSGKRSESTALTGYNPLFFCIINAKVTD